MVNTVKFTDEKAALFLLAALKAYGIKRVIVSPGSTHFTFVGSLQHDDFFELYSCVDERSAAYMACGIAEETGEPVVITCTGATAPRNFLPGLTEAYYRKLPVLAICGHRGVSAIGHLHDQQLDRRQEPTDVAKYHAWLPFVKDEEDERLCKNELHRAMLALVSQGGGPAIITLCTHYSSTMNVQELPHFDKVERYRNADKMPILPEGRIAITIGSHRKFTDYEVQYIDAFCASHDAIVICDHTSGYYGKYAVHAGLIFSQEKPSDLSVPDLVICAGEVSGDSLGLMKVWPPEIWRVCEDGEYRNRKRCVTKVFDMSLSEFCEHYVTSERKGNSYLTQCMQEYDEIYNKIPELPLSNIWMAKNFSKLIPENSAICFGINNSLRSWNLFYLPKNVESMSNVGGYGIDGTLSSTIGRSLITPSKLAFCVLGDLSFFYDMNSLGNRHIGNNLRILLINNGLGEEFRLSDSPALVLGEEVRPFIAAEGHYGEKSPELVKAYVEALGFEYMSASSKEEVHSLQSRFVDPEIKKSMVFEVFVNPENDNLALDLVRQIVRNDTSVPFSKRLKKGIKSRIGEEKLEALKTLLK